MDLGQVALVEERGLQRPAGGQLADRRCPQGGDPLQPGRPHLLADARLGEHAAIAHQHHPREPESAGAPCRSACPVWRDRRCCPRTPRPPPGSLARCTEARTRSAACRACRRGSSRDVAKRTAASFQPGRGDGRRAPGRRPRGDARPAPVRSCPGVAAASPWPRRARLRRHRPRASASPRPQLSVSSLSPRAVGELRARAPRCGRRSSPLRDRGRRERRAAISPIQPEAAQDPEHRCDMAEGTRTGECRRGAPPFSSRLASPRGTAVPPRSRDAQAVDQVRRPLGEVGEGALSDFYRARAMIRAGGLRAASSGLGRFRYTWARNIAAHHGIYQYILLIYMGTLCTRKVTQYVCENNNLCLKIRPFLGGSSG